VDLGVDLYSGRWHVAILEWTAHAVRLHFDRKVVKEITNRDVIPTDLMDLILGPRLVDKEKRLLEREFVEKIDWVDVVS
jgi:hypothetical protein